MLYPERCEDLSIHYWLENKFPTIAITDGYPETTVSTPTIALEWDDLTGQEYELGNREVIKERVWYFFIYAKNKTQRDDFVYKLFNDLQDGIPVYDYNEGFPPSVTNQTQTGTLVTKVRQAKNIPVDPDLVDELRYQAVLIYTAEYNQI